MRTPPEEPHPPEHLTGSEGSPPIGGGAFDHVRLPREPTAPSKKSGYLTKEDHERYKTEVFFTRVRLQKVVKLIEGLHNPRMREIMQIDWRTEKPLLSDIEVADEARLQHCSDELDTALQSATHAFNRLRAHAHFMREAVDMDKERRLQDPVTGAVTAGPKLYQFLCFLETQALQRTRAALPELYGGNGSCSPTSGNAYTTSRSTLKLVWHKTQSSRSRTYKSEISY